MNSYISIDLETTGLNPKLDKIIEIGAVKVIDGEAVDTFCAFLNPGRKLDDRIIELTGITQGQVDSAKEAKDIIPSLVEFVGDLPLLGHRIMFDYSFLKHATVNLNIPFEKSGVDTLKISRTCFPELPSKKLTAMCEHYKIVYDAHRAYNDAEATSKLYQYLKQDFEGKYPELFNPESLIYKAKKESPIRPLQIKKIETLLERYKIECPYDLTKMSRNEASRYIDILLAKCGNGKIEI